MDRSSKPLGLRERKKHQTRERIRAAALELFSARGFDRVRVIEVAAAADVSEATVFNYFPTKEDLIFLGMAEAGHELISTLRERPSGVSVIEAFRDQLEQPRGFLADPDPAAADALLRVRRIIADSPALQAREHMLAAATTAELADLLAQSLPGAIQPGFVAAALIGINRAMTPEICRLAADGMTGPEIARIVLPQGIHAVNTLIAGLNWTARPAEAAIKRHPS